MKSKEFLMILMLWVCLITMSACGKKNGAANVVANDNPYSQDYSYNQQTQCSNQIIYQYQEMTYTCNYARSRYERRQCRYMVQYFINQYPQINCYGEMRYGRHSHKTKNISITEEKLQSKLEQL